jgi:RimJ/RimL family protein N-acetyltransferase
VLTGDTSLPSELRHPQFVATPLTIDLAALDYAAYMASPDVVRVHSAGRWPIDGFTFEDDLELVAKHQRDHQNRRAFTFALLSPTRSESLGCLYLNPLQDYLRRAGADPELLGATPPGSAMVTFWLRQNQQETGLSGTFVEAANTWLRNDWPLTSYLFRVLPDEHASVNAIERADLRKAHLMLPGEDRPYLWFRPA